MTAPTANEQYLIELINRARADPAAEARALGINLNSGLPSGSINGSAKQPLAPVETLLNAADTHSQNMVRDDFFAHRGLDGLSATDRMFQAGWEPLRGSWATGENISARFSTGALPAASTIVSHHEGLFKSPGHRQNILSDRFSEIGVGQATGDFVRNGTYWPNASIATQKFADGGRTFVTGVVIDDRNGNEFYDIGEGLSVTVTVTGSNGFSFEGTTFASGGYSVVVPDNATYTVTFSGGALGGEITETVQVGTKNVKVDGFLQDVSPAQAASFAPVIDNGDSVDGSDDILWQHSDGSVAIWDMDGGERAETIRPGSASSVWEIEGSGDFSGDGSADILWQHSNGTVTIWDMEGGERAGTIRPGSASSAWEIEGVGDFSGDGSADILWQHRNGSVAIWDLEGGERAGTLRPGSASGAWEIEGVGDFTGDGSDDILWQHSNGTVAIWDMDGGERSSTLRPGSASGAWEIEGVGDFSGDGSADILWQHSNGTVAIWDMEGGERADTIRPGSASGAWEIEGVGDFSGDGSDDILWQHSNGTVAIWDMEDGERADTLRPGAASSEWEIEGSLGDGTLLF
ncbi:MAG: FG-GAP-like repeat-containing protein [Pseudomonadota bacterium]